MTQPQPAQTQADILNQILEEMPGDTALWGNLSRRLDHLKRHSDPAYKGPERDHTIDEFTWGHIRNLDRVVRQLAFAYASMEAGHDPDIPF